LRWDLDPGQLSAFRAAIPNLPDSSPLWLLPVALDERIVSPHFGREALLDRYLFGVFEIPLSASDAIRLEYGERDIHTVAAHRWETLHVTSVQRSESGHVITVTIQGRTIPIDHLLAFTYRQGHLIVLSPLVFSSRNAGSSVVVDLPLVARVRSDGLDVQPVRFNLEHP